MMTYSLGKGHGERSEDNIELCRLGTGLMFLLVSVDVFVYSLLFFDGKIVES